jgi:hypothetical protein
MTKHWWVAVGVSCFSFACSPMQAPEAETASLGLTPPKRAAEKKRVEKRTAKHKQALQADKDVDTRVAPRHAGDYFVHRFSGSFRQGPLTLIERVIAEQDDKLIVDYTLEDGATDKTLRVTLDRISERPLRVVELTESGELEVPIAAYEAMLGQTVFSPDVNDELLDETERTCLVGPKELDCEVKQYRVFVGDQEAKLTVTESADLPGRDLGGEVTAVDGSVIYRAELLEAGNTPPIDDSVATK